MMKKYSPFIGWLICLIGAAFYWYEFLLRIEPSVIVSELMRQLSVSASGFGLVVALYYYAYTPMQLLVGILLDRFGTKIILGMSIVSCVIGSFLFSISSSVYLAGISRFLIGFGSSFAFVGVLKLGAEWLPKQHFALLAGLATSLGMLAGMMGDIVLTTLLNQLDWKTILHLGTFIGIVLIPIIFFLVKDTPHPKGSIERLEVSFQHTFIGLKKIIQNPQMWIAGLMANTLYLSLSAFAEIWGIKFLQTVYAIQNEMASFACSFIFFGWLIGGPINGWLSDHISSRKIPLITGGVLSAISMAIIVLNPFDLSFSMLCTLLFLFGCFSSTQILCFAISKESNPHHLAATSVAFTNFLVMIGGMIFQPLLGLLLDLNWSGQMTDNIRSYSATNYQNVFLIIPIFITLGSLLTLKLKETLGNPE